MGKLLRSLILTAMLASCSIALCVAGPAMAGDTGRDLAQEEANRKLVLDFYDTVFNKHDVARGAAVIGDTYIQHNPAVPDGKAPFVNFFTGYFKANPQSAAGIVRSATDGDLVYLHVHATNGSDDRGAAVIDIFRVKDGKIVEHWDVVQMVPAKAANQNTMF